jgi:hypothetical protein
MAGPDHLGKVLASSIGGLTFKCYACNHKGHMPKQQALKTFGDHATPNRIRERLRCSKCGSKKCEVWA